MLPDKLSVSRRSTAAALGIGVAAGMFTATASADPTSLPEGSSDALSEIIPGSSVPGAMNPVDNLPSNFDLQAHRGGRGEYTEESRTAFEKALELGVTTLEFDIHLTSDGVPAVWHDPSLQDDKCTDTEPVTEDDPQFPYVGKDVHDLTWEQIQTVDCDLQLEDYPEAEQVPENEIIDLDELFEIASADPEVHFNIETKIEAEDPERSAAPQEYVDAILDSADAAGTTDRIAIQSFDWSSLPLVRERAPQVPLIALWDETTWKEGSEYLGPINYADYAGDPIAAARDLGVEVLSPSFETDNSWFEGDLAGWVSKAQKAGFRVVPWTVNEAEDINEWIDAGTDGIISDYPTRLKEILDERGIDYTA